MQRVFTKNVGKRFKKGDVRDYPPVTWQQIAANARMKLDTFTTPAANMLRKSTAATMAKPVADADA